MKIVFLLLLSVPTFIFGQQHPHISRHHSVAYRMSTLEHCARYLSSFGQFDPNQHLLSKIWTGPTGAPFGDQVLTRHKFQYFLEQAGYAGVAGFPAQEFLAEKIELFLHSLDQRFHQPANLIEAIFQNYPLDYDFSKNLLSGNLSGAVEMAKAWNKHFHPVFLAADQKTLHSVFHASLQLRRDDLITHALFYLLVSGNPLEEWNLGPISGVRYPDTISAYVLVHQVGMAAQDPTPERLKAVAKVSAKIRGLMRRPAQHLLLQLIHRLFAEMSRAGLSPAELRHTARDFAQSSISLLQEISNPPSAAIRTMIDQLTAFLTDT